MLGKGRRVPGKGPSIGEGGGKAGWAAQQRQALHRGASGGAAEGHSGPAGSTPAGGQTLRDKAGGGKWRQTGTLPRPRQCDPLKASRERSVRWVRECVSV